MNKTWLSKAEKLHDLSQKIKFLNDEKAILHKELVDLSEGKEFSFKGFKFSIISRPGSVDYAKIPVLKGLDLEPFRKDGISYFKLSFKKQFKEIL